MASALSSVEHGVRRHQRDQQAAPRPLGPEEGEHRGADDDAHRVGGDEVAGGRDGHVRRRRATCGSRPIVTNSVVPMAKPPMASASTASTKWRVGAPVSGAGGGGCGRRHARGGLPGRGAGGWTADGVRSGSLLSSNDPPRAAYSTATADPSLPVRLEIAADRRQLPAARRTARSDGSARSRQQELHRVSVRGWRGPRSASSTGASPRRPWRRRGGSSRRCRPAGPGPRSAPR